MKNFLKSKLLFVTIFLLLSSVGIGYIVSKLYQTYAQLQSDKQMSLLAVNITNQVKAQINTMTTAPNILASLLENNNYKTDKFEEWAKELLVKFPNIANLQLARDGIVSHIYPMSEHQGAMGHDLLKDKRRVKGASIAIQSHKLTFVGPLRLIQNNKLAVIARLPIFQSEGKNEVFWGFSTAIVYLEPLLKEGLEQIEKSGFDYQVQGNNPDSSTPALFASNIERKSPYATDFWIEVPNGRWQITLQPHAPVPSYLLEFELFFILMGALFAYLYMHYEKKVNLLLSYEAQIDEKEKYESYLKMHSAKLEKITNDLELERKKYKNLLKYASDEVFIIDAEGNMVEYSNKTKEKLGYSDEEMKTLCVYDWDSSITKEKFQGLISRLKTQSIEIQTKHKTKEGTFYDALVSADQIIQDETMLIYCTVRDITKEKELEKRLLSERNFAQLLIDKSVMILLSDGEKMLYANKAFLDFFACQNIEAFQEMYGCICQEFVHSKHYFYHNHEDTQVNWIDEMLALDQEKRIVSMVSKQNYEPHVFNVRISSLDDRYLISFNDISDRMHKELRLEQKVMHDSLSGAYNREFFWTNIDYLLHTHQIAQKKSAFVMVDIDHFKKVNDIHGHDIGDKVLIGLVGLIKQNLRSDDILVRWGGEEFILILGVSEEKALATILENLRKTINQATIGTLQNLTCSFGATLYQKPESPEETIKRADIALYTSKNTGRDKISFL